MAHMPSGFQDCAPRHRLDCRSFIQDMKHIIRDQVSCIDIDWGLTIDEESSTLLISLDPDAGLDRTLVRDFAARCQQLAS